MTIDADFARSETFLDALMSCIQHGILVADPDGKIHYANHAVSDTFGHSLEELAAESLSAFFTPEDMNYLYPNLLHLVGEGEPFEGEIAFIRKNKTRFLAFVIFRPFYTPSSDRPFALISVQDLDAWRINDATFNKNHCKELAKLADGIAHEMRNPIVGIGGYARRLWKSQEPEDSRTHFAGIMENLQRLEGLVEKVELFARLPKPCLQPASPKAVIEKIVSAYSPQAQSRGIRLTADLQDASLFLDKALLSRAMTILIENAMDAVDGEGEIVVRGLLQENEYRILTRDTGCGISPKDIPHIFDPFFRTKPEGVGIDLTVVKRVVESQGGVVEVESEPGKGTTFTLRFPIERRRSVRTCQFQE